MSIRIMQQQLFRISEYMVIPESLSLLSGFCLETLDYLRGQLLEESFLDSLDAVCKAIIDDNEFGKASPILDSLLTAVFYYKQESACIWHTKRLQKNFSLLLKDTYCQLIEWGEEETGGEFPSINSNSLFEEFALDGVYTTGFPLKNTCKSVDKQLEILQEYQILPVNSRLVSAIMQSRKTFFFVRFPLLRPLSEAGLVCGMIVGCYGLISLFILLGRFFVELPYLKLLYLKGANNAVRIGEIYVLMESLFENGLLLYGMQIAVFALGLLLYFGINFVAEKWVERK